MILLEAKNGGKREEKDRKIKKGEEVFLLYAGFFVFYFCFVFKCAWKGKLTLALKLPLSNLFRGL